MGRPIGAEPISAASPEIARPGVYLGVLHWASGVKRFRIESEFILLKEFGWQFNLGRFLIQMSCVL